MREKFLNLTFRRRPRVIYDKQELKEEVFRLIGLILAHH
jgi:hypothetical protein